MESAQQGSEWYCSKLNRCSKNSIWQTETDFEELQCKQASHKEDCQSKINFLENEMVDLHVELNKTQVEHIQMQEKLNEVRQDKVDTKVHSQLYADNVQQFCLELLSMNLGILKLDPVIRYVLQNIAGITVDSLPKPATLVRMLAELKCFSYQQIADELQDCEKITLLSDGTSKFGQHYGSFQISTETTAYSLRLSQMLTSSAQQTLGLLKQILSDFQLVVGSQAQSKLLGSIYYKEYYV